VDHDAGIEELADLRERQRIPFGSPFSLEAAKWLVE
jgi:hypothetical protein